MKIMIASDIHGSSYYAKRVTEIKEREGADLLVLLGDIYYHGPRNPFPNDYAPKEVANLFNGIKESLIVVKGNCDSQVDTLISEFDFLDNTVIVSGGKKVFCTHGHMFNKDNPPSTKFDAVIYGHFHTGFIERINGSVFANAGSVALPKDGTANSYIMLEDGIITLKDLDGNIIKKENI